MYKIFGFGILLVFNFWSQGQITKQPKNSSICETTNTLFYISDTYNNSSYQWQKWNGSSWVNLSANAPFIGVNNDSLILINVSDTLNNSLFRCRVDSNSVFAKTSDSAKITILKRSIIPSSLAATINPVSCPGNLTKIYKVGGYLGSSASWEWFAASCSGTVIGSGDTLIITPNNTTTYYIKANGFCNTTACTNITISVTNTNSTKSSSLIATTNPISCPGNSSLLYVSGGTLGTGASWKWYSEKCGQKLEGSGITFTAHPQTATIYYARAEGICNTTLCDSIKIFISNSNSTKPGNLSGNSVNCPGSSTQLSFSTGSLGSGAVWKWYSGNCGATLVGNGNPITVNPSISTTYFVRAEGTCNTTICDSIKITVAQSNSLSPKSIIASNNTINCPGDKSTLTVSGGKLGSNANWKWYAYNCGDSLIGSGNSIDVYPISSSNYFVRAEGACDTSFCASIYIKVKNTNSISPISIETLTDTICVGGLSELKVVGGSLGSGADWYWYKGLNCLDSLIGKGSQIKIKPAQTETYFVKATGWCNTTNCINKLIWVHQLPMVWAGKDTAVCLGSNITLEGISPSAKTINWAPKTSLSNSSSLNPIASPIYNTEYILTVIDSNLCKNWDTILIKVNQLPMVDGGADTAICYKTSAYLSGTKGAKAYHWTPKEGLSDTAIYNPLATPLSTTKYTLTITDNNGCKQKDDLRIIVNPKPKADAGRDTAICIGQAHTFNATGGIYYQWAPGFGLDFSNTSNPRCNAKLSTNYTVEVGNIYGCTDKDSVKLTIFNLPMANAGNDATLCLGDSIILKASGGIKFDWQPNLGLKYISNSEVLARPSRFTQLLLKATDINGCSNYDTINIFVNNLPVIKTNNDTLICEGNSFQLSATPNLKQYNWYQNQVRFSQSTNPIVNPTQAVTIYKLVAMDFNNCQNQDSVIVSVKQNPTPKIVSKDTIVCHNYYWAQYCAESTQNSYKWNIDSGNILTGQGTNCVKIHWTAKGDLGKVMLTEAYKNFPFCGQTQTQKVSMKNGLAANPVVLVAKANSISTKTLICQFCNFTYYIWGYESKNPNALEKIISTQNTWCTFNNIDTFSYNYWVKTGDDINCVTKTYFNSPRWVNSLKIPYKNILNLYPNPSKGLCTIESEEAIKLIKIYSTLGNLVDYKIVESKNNTITIDISELSNAVYFINIVTEKGFFTEKIIKQ